MRIERTPKRPRVPPKPRTVEQQQECNNNKNSTNGQDPVDVYCRVRPVDSLDTCVALLSSTTIQISPPLSSVVARSGCAREQQYRFREVFGPECTQKEVFDRVAKPLVSDLLNGKNGLLFAYGVTGSGKTHTMQGVPKDGGIVRRTLDVIFNSISEWQARRFVFKPDHLNGFEVLTDADARQERRQLLGGGAGRGVFKTPRPKRDTSSGSYNSSERVPDTTIIGGLEEDNVYSVFVTYFEAYNNFVYDLLEDLPENNMTKALQTKILREDGQRNMYVHGCNEVEVKSPEDALEQLYKGQKRRKVAHTSLNAESSRSHSIFTIRIVQCPLDEQGAEVLASAGLRVSQLSLVDLAGSERCSRTRAAGLRIKEAGNINNTLMMLRTCIEVLRDNQLNGANRMVPYRDSKITHYFKNYFDGEGKVKMIICVNPLSSDYDETLPVMKFAELASEVQVQRSVAREAPSLPPGRRRANLLFREVRRNMLLEGMEKAKDLEMDIRPIYSLSPAWPDTVLTDDCWQDTLARLKAFLQRRLHNRENMLTDAKEKATALSERVISLESEALVLRQHRSSLQVLYEERERTVRDYEAMLLNAEAVNESLYNNYNNLVEDYNQALEERNLAHNQGQLEKQRLKAKLNTKLEIEREKQDRDFQNKLKEHKSKMVSTQVRALQQFAEGASSSSSDATPSGTGHTATARTPAVFITPSTPSLAGDVLPTTGGGSQVVFQDVEILKQRGPLDVPRVGGLKRDSDGAPTPGSLDAVLTNERWRGLTAPASPASHTPFKRSRV